MKHKGMHTYRLKGEPLEAAYADAWQRMNDVGHVLDYMLSTDNKRVCPSDRDVLVAATVIQWLGSPVGSSFVRDVLSGMDAPDFE